MAKKVVEPEPEYTVLRTGSESLACKLTDPERLERGRELAQTLEDIKALESEHEMEKRAMKSDMASLEAKRDRLSLELSRGEEKRTVDTEDRTAKDNRVERVRKDTGEVIFSRAMTPEELQHELSLEVQAGGDDVRKKPGEGASVQAPERTPCRPGSL